MTQLKKNSFYFLFSLILHAPILCMELPLSLDVLQKHIIPLLDFTAKDSLGKSCKTYYKAIEPANLVLNKNDCNNLTFNQYTNVLLYNDNHKKDIIIKTLIKATKIRRQKNFAITKGIYELSGWSIDPLGEDNSTIIDTYKEILAQCQKEDSQKAHYAITKNNIIGLKFFFKINDNPNIKDDKGKTPLHVITCRKDNHPFDSDGNNQYEINTKALIKNMRLLLTYPNVICNIQDVQGNTPLHYAANFKLVDYLLTIQDNIDLNVKNNQGETPLFYSLQHRGTAVKKGFKHDTIAYNDYQFERLCDDLRTDVNTQNNSGETPLHYLINNTRITEIEHHSSNDMYFYPTLSYDNKQTQQLLKRSDIDPNKKDTNKETPLHCAVKINSKTRVYNGERQSLEDHYKKSILKLGDQIYLDNIQLLLTHPDTIINPTNKDGETPLICAVKASNISAIEKLLLYIHDNLPNHKKIEINIKDNNGSTALDHASIINNQEIIDLLTKHGATHESFFYRHKKTIQLCSLVGLMGMLASVMAYLHYR